MTHPTPLPYQKEGVLQIRQFRGRALLADEMGLGKTLQALWYMQKARAVPAVIVCPASLKPVWQRESARIGMTSTVLSGKVPPPSGFDKTVSDIYIVNYDILKPWLKHLQALKPQCLVLDECHALSNRSTQRTKASKTLSKGVPHLIGISGTPMTNRPAEMFPILNMLHPDKYPTFPGYAARYCRPKLTPWGWDYSGAQNLRELHAHLRGLCMIRRLKKDVLKDLPLRQQHVLPVAMSDPAQYQEASTNFLDWLRGVDPAAVKRAKRAEAVSKINALRLLAAKLKRRAMVAHFDQVLDETGEKLVISCIHHRMIDSLAKYYGERAVVLDGRMPLYARQVSVDRFQQDPTVKVFLGQLMAAGTGITLTASSKVYFAEMGWRPGDHSQMADRVHRIGQQQPCTATYVVAADSIEEMFCEVLQQKQLVIRRAIDGETDLGGFDIYDQLLESIRK